MTSKIKCILLGDSSVGKTSILTRLRHDTFHASSTETIGVDFCCVSLSSSENQGHTTTLCVWDTAGSEKYRSLFTRYYKGSHIVLCVCDLYNKSSWHSLSSVWLSNVYAKIGKDANIILIVNKCDDESMDTTKQCKEFESFFNSSLETSSIRHVVYTSAKTSLGIDKLKDALVNETTRQIQVKIKEESGANVPEVVSLTKSNNPTCICKC